MRRGFMGKEGMENPKPCMDIKFQWTAGEVMFECPCGTLEIIMTESREEKTCDCGRVYKLHHFVSLKKEGIKKEA
jgi:hypothetical protein